MGFPSSSEAFSSSRCELPDITRNWIGEHKWPLRYRTAFDGSGYGVHPSVTSFTMHQEAHEQCGGLAASFDDLGRKYPPHGVPWSLSWVGLAGAKVCKKGYHRYGAAVDLTKVSWGADRFVDLAVHGKDGRVRLRRRYLAVVAMCRKYFGTVLHVHNDPDGSHWNHIHVDRGRSVVALDWDYGTDVTIIQWAARDLAGMSDMAVDGVWGPQTRSGYERLRDRFKAGSVDPTGSVGNARAWLNVIAQHAMANQDAGAFTVELGDDMADRRSIIGATACGVVLAGGLLACDDGSAGGEESEPGVLYGVGDDHRLWRWDVGEGEPEAVLDASGVWERGGDVGLVFQSTLSIAPDQRHASWVSGGTPDSDLQIVDLETGELTGTVPYPVDHACVDPVWSPDGSAVMAHRVPVWGDTGAPVEVFGSVEWFSPTAEKLDTATVLDEGCRVRWYESDGEVEGIYHDLAVTELYRVSETGEHVETIPIDSLSGVEPAVTGLAEVDPSGRYVCLADGYEAEGGYEGGFVIRPQTGSRVIDLSNGEAAGQEGSGCESLTADGYLARADTAVKFIDYEGETLWEEELPPELANSPNLFYFQDA
ncbi:hypothetical protein [Glycomyces tenuis]|uniref:hypothetical protein n=1 Tax=Glycomyces tenuis TaxID=58116 RepID=UPI000429D728|nr:hypothetical protein [Glycomyces tenuis]